MVDPDEQAPTSPIWISLDEERKHSRQVYTRSRYLTDIGGKENAFDAAQENRELSSICFSLLAWY